jgi:YidC/Oxa1 family membrane protein insertase
VPKQEEQKLRQQQAEALKKEKGITSEAGAPVATKQDGSPEAPSMTETPIAPKTRKAALALTKRVPIETPAIRGSVNLTGGRIDDILLREHRETVDKKSPPVELFSPSGSPHPYFAEFGWSSVGADGVTLPGPKTEWQLKSGTTLAPGQPITLSYEAGKGVVFERTISVDDKYMFTVTQKVINNGEAALTVSPYGYLWRQNKPYSESLFISHEGAVGVFNEELEETTYNDLIDEGKQTFKAKEGWVAITDKYWASALIPDKKLPLTSTFVGRDAGGVKSYQTTFLLDGQVVNKGETFTVSNQLFAGAKRGRLLEQYGETYKIDRFENLIDWGWFHFITKPMFHALVYVNDLVGNFGVSILIITVLIKLLLFPLANKSYKSMAAMKKMQPEMEKIRKRYESDKVKQQQELMALYKKEKINPVSGCWPVLVQIPIFFALYKVLYVTIEMRHAPFFGWIQDLSAPDPTSLFNLFGLIPIDLPSFLMIGIWPLIMGLTMYVQMKLNPAPPDPVQAKLFTYMPIIFTFILAGFSAGLVIYWAWNNFLSIIQQYVIMRRQGVEVTLLENMGLKKSS